MNIDPELTARAFARMNGSSPVDIMKLHAEQNFFTDYEKGLIDDETFRENLRVFMDTRVSDMEIDEAWNALLLDLPEPKVDLITRAKEQHRTFLLSNTNHIHSTYFEKTFLESSGQPIGHFFEKVYYSYRMHKRKPDADIFEQVLQENGLQRDETLLIDDSLPNIETARRLGMQTMLVNRNQEEIRLWI